MKMSFYKVLFLAWIHTKIKKEYKYYECVSYLQCDL